MDSAPFDEAALQPPAAAGSFRAGLPARLRASGVHLALCVAVYAVAAYLILARWYPGFHFTVDGGWQGMRIMAAVDLVIGPLLTLVIFNPFKRRRAIAFDLTCIAVAQVAALAWGFYAIHSQHPVAVSYRDGTFHPVLVEPLRIEKYDPDRLAALSPEQPPLVFSAPPVGDAESTRAALQDLIGQVMPYEDPFFFRPFAEHWSEVRAAGRDLAAQRQAGVEGLDAFVAQHGSDASGWRFYDYDGRFGACTVALAADGKLIGAFACRPF